jgi:UDP-N-acetylglucosamine:LPS N-acetylglucosamine transferase
VFKVTDRPTVKRLIVGAIVRFYGPRIRQMLEQFEPDVIIVLHPLFISDVLCELRNKSRAEWKIVSLVTDLGIAHSGWTAPSLDLAIFVAAEQIEKLRSQGCLPPDSRIMLTKAPVRGAFVNDKISMDGMLMETLGLERPYILFIPGLQPDRAIVRQVRHLSNDYQKRRIAVVGSVHLRVITKLKGISPGLMHLDNLSGAEMAATIRNAELVAGKAGPAVMAEAASVCARFIPTSEVGCQESGNALIGRSLYGIDEMPWWGEAPRKRAGQDRANPSILAYNKIASDAEMGRLLIRGAAERGGL